MKKKILIWSMLFMVASTYSFAKRGDSINPRITTSFKKDFVNAMDAKWEIGKSFVKVTFRLNDEVVFAYYGQNAELLGISRNIISSQLPIVQFMELKRNFADYWISDLFELEADLETSYYITLENADSKLILKSLERGGWEVYRKEVKM